MTTNSLAKPIKGTAKKARAKRGRVKRQMQSDNRIACFERDKGRCRACYTPGLTLDFTDSPFGVFHAHHMVYRSLGGSDGLDNLLGACPKCHAMLHQKRLIVTGEPNGTLIFREYDRQTRELLRKWESAV